MIRCTATLSEEALKENLKQCIGILGGTPVVKGDIVSVDYDGPNEQKFAELFEQFSDHTISVRR